MLVGTRPGSAARHLIRCRFGTADPLAQVALRGAACSQVLFMKPHSINASTHISVVECVAIHPSSGGARPMPAQTSNGHLSVEKRTGQSGSHTDPTVRRRKHVDCAEGADSRASPKTSLMPDSRRSRHTVCRRDTWQGPCHRHTRRRIPTGTACARLRRTWS